ncbi:MAG: PD-(D/E)XK nuclease family protein [Candidatus Obscuribacterales bacterium]|nr:PD-(D/E)XK nuclease family protein [Candidatus Obscuribacterales bacterium]
MLDQSVSYSDLQAFLRCPQLFLDRMTFGWMPPTPEEAVSNALHAIASHRGDLKASKLQVDLELAKLSEKDQAAARAELAVRGPQVAAVVQQEDPNAIRERVFRWFDPVSKWTLCAKPDRVRWVPQGRTRLLEITDYKDSLVYNKKRRKQLYFFALVLSRALDHNDKIRLCVKHLPRGGRQPEVQLDEFYYSHWLSEPELREIRVQLSRIDAYIAASKAEFPRTAGWFCGDCRLAADCAAKKSYDSGGRVALPTIPVPPVAPQVLTMERSQVAAS